MSVWTTRPPGGRTFPECCQVIVGSGSDSRLHSINRSPWIEQIFFFHMWYFLLWSIYWTEWIHFCCIVQSLQGGYRFFDRFHVNQWHFYAYFSESFEFRPTAVLQSLLRTALGREAEMRAGRGERAERVPLLHNVCYRAASREKQPDAEREREIKVVSGERHKNIIACGAIRKKK